MKILVLCDHGNNRSQTLAQRLKYVDYRKNKQHHDVVALGLKTNGPAIIHLLSFWADIIILTDDDQSFPWANGMERKVRLWKVGPDIYPRPFNRELMTKCDRLIQENIDDLRRRWNPPQRSSHAKDRSVPGSTDPVPHRPDDGVGDNRPEGAGELSPDPYPHPYAAGGDADPHADASPDASSGTPGPAGSGPSDSHAVPVRDEHLHQ